MSTSRSAEKPYGSSLFNVSLCILLRAQVELWGFLTDRVSCLPDGNLAGKDVEVFPRLTVIPELGKKKKPKQTK